MMKPILIAALLVAAVVAWGTLLRNPATSPNPSKPAIEPPTTLANPGPAIASPLPVAPSGGPQREPVPGPAEPPPPLRATGHALLLDSSPIANCKLWAIDAAAAAPSPDELRSGVLRQPAVLCEASTKADGGFELSFPSATPADQQFRIWHPLDAVEQVGVVYRLATARGLDYRLPAGRIEVHARDVDGVDVADVLVWLRSTDGEQLTGQTGAGGRCEFFLATARTFDLLAYHSERRAGARLNRIGFDPHVGVLERLVLQPMDSGALRIEVTDQAGKPVSDFALRVRLWGRSIRLARSDELLDGCLTGLPETEVAVQIERPYSREPALYEPPKQVERRIVTPDSRATPTLKFRIRLMARLCFDVAANGALPHLLVRMRRSSNTGEEAWQTLDVEQYSDKGSTDSDSMRSLGRWFTKPVDPGYYEVMVHREDSSEAVFREWIDLDIGSTVIRRIEI